MKLPEAAQATLRVLRDAGYEPSIEQSKRHLKIRASGLPMIVCSLSASDWRSRMSAETLARRLIRQAGVKA